MGKKSIYEYETVKKFIEVESGSGCKLLSKKYINNSSKMSFRCRCGNPFQTSFSKFKNRNKRQCNNCGRKNIGNRLRKTKAEVEQEVYNLVKDEYSIVEGEVYVNNKTGIKMKHKSCGHLWSATLDNFINKGTRCPQCNHPNYNRNTEQFKKEVLILTNGKFKVLGEYKSARNKILIKHNIKECGYEWKVTPCNFLRGSRCPQCNESKGEEKIRLYLEDKKIKYKSQYTFDDLIGIGCGLLKFDFAVFDSDNNIIFLIEYDGEFHFEKQYSNDKFETTKTHDELKNQYCKDKNIKLLRIPYWKSDAMEAILQSQLDNYKEVLYEKD